MEHAGIHLCIIEQRSAHLTLLAALIVFAIAAGWATAKVTSLFAQRAVSSLIGIASVGIVVGWSVCTMQNLEPLAETLILGWFLLVLSAIDVMTYRLPNALTIPLVGIGILLSTAVPIWDWEEGPVAHMAAATAGYIALWAVATVFRRWRGIEGLGLGDVKLFAAAGAWLGWRPLPVVLLIACLAGLLWIGIRSALQGRQVLRERLPFGAPLCLAFWLAWLYSSVS